jgi:hypothetical protein
MLKKLYGHSSCNIKGSTSSLCPLLHLKRVASVGPGFGQTATPGLGTPARPAFGVPGAAGFGSPSSPAAPFGTSAFGAAATQGSESFGIHLASASAAFSAYSCLYNMSVTVFMLITCCLRRKCHNMVTALVNRWIWGLCIANRAAVSVRCSSSGWRRLRGSCPAGRRLCLIWRRCFCFWLWDGCSHAAIRQC